MSATPPGMHCSFCGKSQHEVRKLIAGPVALICDECIDLSVDIIREDGVLRRPGLRTRALHEAVLWANGPGREAAYADQVVDQAEKFLAFLKGGLTEVRPHGGSSPPAPAEAA